MTVRFARRPGLSTVLIVMAALVAVVAALALVSRPAAAADAAAVTAAKAALQAAVDGGEAGPILAARGQFATLSAAEPKDPSFHYWVALAAWRAVPMLSNNKAKAEQARKICKDAIERCDRALALAPKHADALALKAGLQGLWLSFEPGEMMSLGMQMGQSIERARELEPANPRVLLLDGINTLHKPAFVGGGADKALVKFDEAIAFYDKQAAAVTAAATSGDPAALGWGRDDALLWAGRAAAKESKLTQARDYYKRALLANPENSWVKNVLLPQIENKLAEKGSS
jgi:tetratricopeptide (TPR) repeat protein